MKVLITGASGFVGAYTTAALVDAGHDVRAFVRSTDKLARALEPLGAPDVEVVEGDVLDPAGVAGAVEGAEAVIHAANVYSLSTRRAAEMDRVNVGGTESVLSAAVAAGCDPVVHISTYVALLGGETPIPADPPIGERGGRPYIDSKIGAEEIARRFQAQDAPVVTTYPGQVFGPHDPGGGEMVNVSRLFLGSSMPPGLTGRIGIVDVGWLGRLHAALMVPGMGPRRVNAPGITIPWTDFGRALYQVAGRPLPRYMPAPYPVAFVAGQVGQALARRTGWNVPINAGGPWIARHWQPGDDTVARGLAGELPPLDETLTSSVRWMAAAGHLTPRQAGKLAAAAPA